MTYIIMDKRMKLRPNWRIKLLPQQYTGIKKNKVEADKHAWVKHRNGL